MQLRHVFIGKRTFARTDDSPGTQGRT